MFVLLSPILTTERALSRHKGRVKRMSMKTIKKTAFYCLSSQRGHNVIVPGTETAVLSISFLQGLSSKDTYVGHQRSVQTADDLLKNGRQCRYLN